MSRPGLAGLLFDSRRPGDEVVVHLDEQATTRDQLQASARALREALRSAGVPPRAAVGVLLANGPALVAAIFGVPAADAAYVPLNPRLPRQELAAVVGQVRPAVVVTDTPDRVPASVPLVQPTGDGGWQVTRPIAPEAALLGEDVAFVQFTSGTTGRPKPVPLRAATVLARLDAVIATLRGQRSSSPPNVGAQPDKRGQVRDTPTISPPKVGAQPDERGQERSEPGRQPMPNLVPLSLSLWAGIYNVLFAFRVGAPVVLMRDFETRTFADAVRRFAVRSVVLPPAALTMLADDEAIRDLAPLRLVRSVSAPLSPLQARRFHQRFGVTVLNGYGQTELGGEVVGWSAADARAHGEDKLGAIGRPHAGVELRIVGEDGHELAPDEVGELWIRTPQTTSHPSDPALAERLSPDGYLRTGDLARIDAEGFVWLEGRRSDMINRGGLKVFPGEVAEVLRLHPAVSDAAVVGVPDERLGEVPWAFVVGPEPVDAEELRDLCRTHLVPYKLPAEMVQVPELPRNELGKVVPGRLAALAQATRAKRAGPGGAR